jgi:protein-S-isoprenylcysteine O-methyltransferase Ste14
VPGLFTGDTPRETAMAWLFVAVQAALLVAVIVLPPGDTWPVPGWLALAGRALQLVGLVVLALALVNLGTSLTALPTPTPHSTLKTTGLYRFVRHPIYTGVLALVFGSAVVSANPWSLGCALALAGWFSWKARWEETRLRRRYPDYDAYAARTPRFVPFVPTGRHRTGPQ